MTSIVFSASCLANSTSSIIKASIPFTNACVILSCNEFSLQDKSNPFSTLEPFTVSAKSNKRSVASSLRSRITSSTRSNKSFGMSS